MGKRFTDTYLEMEKTLNFIAQNVTADMFAKSELVDDALKVFFKGWRWGMVFHGFSLHGKGELGVEFSLRMEKDQRAELIDQFTCVAVLHCCPTACTAEEGKIYFKLMPSLLASCSCLPFDEARAFIWKHRIERHAEVLAELLDRCWIHHRQNTGERFFKHCWKLIKSWIDFT